MMHTAMNFLDRFQFLAYSPRFRRWRGGWWYQIFIPYKENKQRGRLKWLRCEADHARGEWCNDVENHVPSVSKLSATHTHPPHP